MKYKSSLSFRIIVGFSAMGIILITVYGFLIYGLIKNFENKSGTGRLQHDMAFYLEEYDKDRNARLLHSPNLTSYIGVESLPEKFRSITSGLENGIYKTGPKGIGGQSGYSVAIGSLPQSDQKVILVHDNERTNYDKRRIRGISFILILVAAAVIILGAGLSFLLSKRVIAPLTELARTVGTSGPDNLPTDFSGMYANDEVGALAWAFEEAMDRIRDFVERERQFTRDSSHELRSPLTVIKGALAVLKIRIPEDDEKSKEVIERIERATASMENTVECFLWLSREESGTDPPVKFSVADIVEQEVESCQFIMAKREVSVEFIKISDPEVTGPVHVFTIVVSNLIRNALRYTDKGFVKITVYENSVEVSDTGVGMDPSKVSLMQEPHQKGESSSGFGLGLNIVKRICERFEWKLSIESEKGRGTRVELYFD